MPSCFLCGRSRNSTSKLMNITFHRFFTIQIVKEKWCNFVLENGLSVSDINQYSMICSSHFDTSLFITHKNSRRLPKTAVPNIKLPLNEIGNKRVELATQDDKISQLDISEKSIIMNTDKSSSTIQVIASNISCEGVSPLDESMESNVCPLETSTIPENMNASYLIASGAADVDDTPRRTFLKQQIHKLSELFNTGNCIPLDNIEILHYSSSDPVKMINNSTFNHNVNKISIEENIKDVDDFMIIFAMKIVIIFLISPKKLLYIYIYSRICCPQIIINYSVSNMPKILMF